MKLVDLIRTNHLFEEMLDSLNKTINDYENIALVGDSDITVRCPEKYILNHLKDFIVLFSKTTLRRTATCSKGPSGTALDVILTNKTKCFHHTSVFTTELIDCYKHGYIILNRSNNSVFLYLKIC